MTISAVSPRVVYSGASSPGNLGPFAIQTGGTPISFSDSSHIKVRRYASATATSGTLLVEGTDYDLTNYDASGPTAGTITLTSPQTGLLTAERLVISREQNIEQPLDLTAVGSFGAEDLERRLDGLTEMIAEVDNKASRTITQHFSETMALSLPAASARANRVLSFDANGNIVATFSVSDLSEDQSQDLADITAILDQASSSTLFGWDGAAAPKAYSIAELRTLLNISNVDNTSDENKPVSTAQATADGLRLLKSENLGDLPDVSTARDNLELGTSATFDVIDEDDMSSDSETAVPTQQSVKAYVDSAGGTGVSPNGHFVDDQGTWDASGGSFPGAGEAQEGWEYRVSTGGAVDSVAFATGDLIRAITDNASTSTYAGNWVKLSTSGSGIADTDGLDEGEENLYFTATRARDAAAVKRVYNLTALKALDTTVVTTAHFTASGSVYANGIFDWTLGNFSSLVSADSAGAYFVKADAVSASTGAWVRRHDWRTYGLNPMHFGAVPDATGSASANGTAFTRAASLLTTLGGGKIYLGSSTYYLNSRWSVSTNKRFILKGDGKNSARLIFTGTSSGGIDINNTVGNTPTVEQDRYVEVSGFSILAAAVVNSNALDIDIQSTWGGSHVSTVINEVHVTSLVDSSTQYFNDGIVVRNWATNLRATNWSVHGHAASMANGFRFVGPTAAVPSGQGTLYHPNLDNFSVYGVGIGVHITGGIENLLIGDKFEVLANNKAFYIDGSASPLISSQSVNNPISRIGGGHANADVQTVHIKNWNAIVIDGLNAYHGLSSPTEGGCFLFENCKNIKLNQVGSGNAPVAATEKSIVFSNCQNVTVDNTIIDVYSNGSDECGGIYMGTDCVDINIGPMVEIKSSSANKMTYNIFAATEFASSTEIELSVLGPKLMDAVYAIYTINGRNCIFDAVRIKNSTNGIVEAGTPADTTNRDAVTYA